MGKHHKNDKLIKAAGTRLRLIREELDMTQEEVWFQRNIVLSGIENGHKNMTFGTLIELCDLYNISLKEFFKRLGYYD